MKNITTTLGLLLVILAACSPGSLDVEPAASRSSSTPVTIVSTHTSTPTGTATLPPTSTATPSLTPTATSTTTSSPSPTITLTPTDTRTPTITPTPEPLKGYVNVAQANCRYGPGWAYLYKFGLYEDISVEILGRTERGDWVFVLPKWYESGCWIRADLLEIEGDVFSVAEYYGSLPFSFIYPPPWITEASRDGNEVFIAWSDVRMTADKYRGYLLETWLCQDGELVFTPVNVDGLWTTFLDEPGCSEPS